MAPNAQPKNLLSSSPSRMFDNFIFEEQTPRVRNNSTNTESWAQLGHVLDAGDLYYKSTSPSFARNLQQHQNQQQQLPFNSSPANATLGFGDAAHFHSLMSSDFPFNTGTTPIGDRSFRVSDFLQEEGILPGNPYGSPTKFYESLLGGKESETPYSKKTEDAQLRLKTPLREVSNRRRSKSPLKRDTFATPATKQHQSSPSTIIIASSHANTVQRKATKNDMLQSPTPAKSFSKQLMEKAPPAVPTMGIFSDKKKKPPAPYESKKRALTDMQSGMNRFQIVMTDVNEFQAKSKKKRTDKQLTRSQTQIEKRPLKPVSESQQNRQNNMKKQISRSVSVPSYSENAFPFQDSKDMSAEQFLGNLLKNRDLLDGGEDAGLDALFELDPQLLEDP